MVERNLDTVEEQSDVPYDMDVEKGVSYLRYNVSYKILNFFKRNLSFVMMVAVVSGAFVGFLCRQRQNKYTKREVMYAGYLGSLYIRMLQCTTFPLFTTSILTAFGNLDWRSSRTIVRRTFGFFLYTLVVSGAVGAIIVFTIKPGTLVDTLPVSESNYLHSISIWHYVLDIIRNLIPANIIEACIKVYITEMKPVKQHLLTDTGPVLEAVEEPITGTNYLGLIVVSSALGISFSYLGAPVKVCLALAEALNQLCIHLTLVLLHLSPPGMFCVAVSQMLEVKDFYEMFVQMGLAIAVVLLGLVIHSFVTLALTYFVFCRKNPYRFYWEVLQAVVTSWATSSTIATIPVSLENLEHNANVKKFTARFIIPLAANLNQSGSTMYTFVIPCFLAQNRQLEVSLGQYAFAWCMSLVSTITAPSIPGGSLYGIKMVMSVLGVPGEDYELIVMIDPLLDRFCASVNILGDCVAAAYLDHMSHKEVTTGMMKEKTVEDYPEALMLLERQQAQHAAYWYASRSRRPSMDQLYTPFETPGTSFVWQSRHETDEKK